MIQSEDPSPAEIHERAAQIRSQWTEEQRLSRAYCTLGTAFGDGRQVELAARWHREVSRQAEQTERQG